jgi:membrane associated rhomboid family serine protease
MTSESRDYFRGEQRPLGFERWGGTPAAWGLIIATSALWLVYAGTANRIAPGGTVHEVFRDWLSLAGRRVVEQGRVWQVVTHVFVHDPSNILNLGGLVYTIAFVFFVGRPLERMFGGRWLIGMYLAGGAFAGLLATAWVYLVGWPEVPIATGSGAVYAIVIALAVREPGAVSWFGLPLIGISIFLLCLHVAIALTQPFGEVFSFLPVAGAAFGWLQWKFGASLGRRFGGMAQRARARRDERAARVGERERERLDSLLEKIERDGIGSLTAAEKDFLQEASKRAR